MIGFVGGGTNPRYNAEGYLDLTAYNAIYGGKDMVEWKAGDIVSLYLMDGRESIRIILKPYNRYATTMTLFEEERYENEFEVVAMTKMHADLGRIGFTSGRDLETATLVRSMKDSELQQLLVRIAETIGVPADYYNYIGIVDSGAASGTDIDELAREIKELRDKYDAAETEKGELQRKYDALKEKQENNAEDIRVKDDKLIALMKDVAKASAERDVYKDLYSEILNRFVSASARANMGAAS